MHLVGFIIRIIFTMHDYLNVKFENLTLKCMLLATAKL